MATIETDTEVAEAKDVESAFVRLIRGSGIPRTAARKIDVQPPLPHTADGETDCWTHAWHYAERVDGRYVEGICIRGKGLATHAWVEVDGPFGPVIIETTAGYEQARDYVGLIVDRHHPAVRNAIWDGTRYSMIQLCIANRIDPLSVLGPIQ